MISRRPLDQWLAGANYYWFFTGVMLCAAVAFVGVALRYSGKTYNPEST
jgi:hypothetical protein